MIDLEKLKTVEGCPDSFGGYASAGWRQDQCDDCLDDAVAEARVKAELSRKLFAVLHDSDEGGKE